ncbi:uncharacterized protein LOC129313367 [Prosopis cineraria]|uniref:uncharacterized protein LOC129313367 n=1 Tax=Prosopis cineraria TaxID=364024 RepID=UPI002410053E|nr:uncharacterized protein LOC129313367 [Prosopis cineraria]
MWKSPGYVLRSSALSFPMHTTLSQFSRIKFSTSDPTSFHADIFRRRALSFVPLETRGDCFRERSFKLRACRETLSFFGGSGFRNGVLLNQKGCKGKANKRIVLVKSNQGFGFNDGDDTENGASANILGNLALAIGLAYLTTTGQLGWILDAIVSIWIFAVLVPIVGLGAFLWWAGRDIMQGSCPNCGNAFQVFKSLNDDLQLCPFCGLPFSVVGDEFVKESVKFSNQPTTFGQAFNNNSSSRNEKDSIRAIDVEAEIKDVD